jgi:hypothetical protein
MVTILMEQKVWVCFFILRKGIETPAFSASIRTELCAPNGVLHKLEIKKTKKTYFIKRNC